MKRHTRLSAEDFKPHGTGSLRDFRGICAKCFKNRPLQQGLCRKCDKKRRDQ